MSKLKKLASALLALVMAFGLTCTAFAADTYTITITSDKSGHTYEAYQVFTGDLDSTKTVLSNVEWGSGVDGSALLNALQADTTVVDTDNTTDPATNITVGDLFASCTAAADVAKVLSDNNSNTALAGAFAQIASENLSTTVAGTSTEDPSYTYKITNLSAGYYLVKDKDDSVNAEGDAYTDIILEVVDDVKVKSKAVYPTVKKEVSDIDANISDTVTYTLTGTVPDTSSYDSYTYIFHDTLSKGLTYTTNSLTVTVDSTQLIVGTDYTVTTTDVLDADQNKTGETAITITMKNAKSLSGKTIIVTYTATLNSDAVIGSTGNTNEVYVEYSNNPNWDGKGTEPTGETPEDEVVTFTFELDVTKVDGKDSNKTLKGAEFVLYKTVTEKDQNDQDVNVTYYVTVDTNSKVTGWTTDSTKASTLVSDDSGDFSIIGLDAGTYYLKETKAPDGYNLLADPITIVITATYKDTDGDGTNDAIGTLTATADGKSLTTSTSTDIIDAEVANNAGSSLPSTGGIGTTIFYVVGGVLVVGAVVLLITKKRMGE